MLTKIISGGQTGADQGGLEGGRRCGIATGGVAPLGYRTEKGKEADLLKGYGLVEHPSEDYKPRTRMNVVLSHGTVWYGRLGSPGYKCTAKACEKFNRPFIDNPGPEALALWVGTHNIGVLNIAGNRESKNPGLYEKVVKIIVEAFGAPFHSNS